MAIQGSDRSHSYLHRFEMEALREACSSVDARASQPIRLRPVESIADVFCPPTFRAPARVHAVHACIPWLKNPDSTREEDVIIPVFFRFFDKTGLDQAQLRLGDSSIASQYTGQFMMYQDSEGPHQVAFGKYGTAAVWFGETYRDDEAMFYLINFFDGNPKMKAMRKLNIELGLQETQITAMEFDDARGLLIVAVDEGDLHVIDLAVAS
jgi:hypothetical protein